MRKFARSIFLLGFVQLMLVLSLSPASGHLASEWYPQFWWEEQRVDGVQWRFVEGAPGAGTNWRERVKEGSYEWNQLGQLLRFDFLAGDWLQYPAHTCPASVEKNGVHFGDVSDIYIAETYLCTYAEVTTGGASNRLHSFQIKFDSLVNWYTLDPGPPTGSDLESVAVHEFGHAGGRADDTGGYTLGDGEGHFNNSASYCNPTEAEHHTMCQSTKTDRIWDRSLNEHDRDAFENKY